MNNQLRERTAALRRQTFPLDHCDDLWKQIPRHLQPAILNYIRGHRLPGHFLAAVFRNDLVEAITRSDDESGHAVAAVVRYMLASAPSCCWGDSSKVEAWVSDKQVEEARDDWRPSIRLQYFDSDLTPVDMAL